MLKRMVQFLAISALLTSGCASTSSGPTAQLARPKVTIIARTNLADTAPSLSAGVPMHYEIRITNQADIPITLKRIDLDAMAGGGFQVQSRTRVFDVTIAPAETRSVDFDTTAYINDPTGTDARQPVAIRAITLFETTKGKLQSITQQRVSIVSGD